MHHSVLQNLERSLKFLFRSGSSDMMLNWNRTPPQVRRFRVGGHPFYYRTGTTDLSAINEVLLRKGASSEYHFPLEGIPEVILDIGAHIGSSAVYFARLFPSARIYALEPHPDNFELLQRNVAPYPKVHAFNIGLGAENGSFPMFEHPDPASTSGRSLFPDLGDGVSTSRPVTVRNTADFLREQGLAKVDLIKIDTEGAEHAILTSFPEEILRRVGWIIGELHDIRDFELLAHLSPWFHIGMQKEKVRFRYSLFRAVNRSVVAAAGSYE
ncbi:MAG: FkbM family methyltransferase [Verrucomicrobiales bacterium]|nr:FkbM family methyltransferase [Verrucomicrobiales bacterium]